MSEGQDDPTGLPASAASLYRAALGPAGTRAYLPVIARFEERGRSALVWNTRAALGQLAWLAYWRLWSAAFAQAGLALAAAAALGWLWMRAESVPTGIRIGLTASALVLWCALPGLWGMAWLHRGLRERVAAAVEQADSFQEAVEQLERSEYGWRVAGLLVAATALVVVALLAGVVGLQWRPAFVDAAQAQPLAPPRQQPQRVSPPPVASPIEAPPAPPDVLPVLAPVEPVAAAPATASAPAAPEPPLRPRPRGYGVNVGMFAKEANAERAKARLVEAGLPVLDDPIESARGPLTRVRVGPFERREEAEAAAAKVRALGLEARVYTP